MTACLDIRAERERVTRAFRPGRPLPDFGYSSEEDALWSRVFATLRGMHEDLSCMAYQGAAQRVKLPTGRVPQLSEVSRTLRSLTGFELAPAMGAVPGPLFYGPLAKGILTSTPDVRPVTEQSFSPDPDVIHELVGHGVMLADPEFAELYRRFGRAALHADSDEVRTAISRLFWFTMEVGLVIENGRPRACGAAILSSVAEMESFEDAELRDFRVEDVIASDIDDSICQPVLYVADSVSQMMDAVERFLAAGAEL
ncbi:MULTISPECIES: amino acid hydroxylase [Gordonia]|uniref:Amino acid hydroxylase n=1 Tax=Gordonia amicalis TaxID=89053 RepID=A0AAE4R9P5_9ACTN|nr:MULTISPECIES: amino acid hydroxylase [Gordonia]ATD71304.1 amino acid hydroxylase [Gordonia sp. 1D]MCR8899198.1 amino acid hydroxylase [Gordonia sp. GONU]MCZ4580589.1 amino acid hydroxylase [Gordonia amicalis]MCZ4652176.1 amino acid hydroxylase [Gordonia amicalis]MDJ0453715.1 amino acid hydroxylase [Gordonia amicalis]